MFEKKQHNVISQPKKPQSPAQSPIILNRPGQNNFQRNEEGKIIGNQRKEETEPEVTSEVLPETKSSEATPTASAPPSGDTGGIPVNNTSTEDNLIEEKTATEEEETTVESAPNSTAAGTTDVPDEDPPENRLPWANLNTKTIVTRKLGLDYEAVKAKFIEVNGNISNVTLRYWIRECVINGWSSLDETPPNIREIVVTWKTENDRGQMVNIPYIEAYSYDDAFAKAGALGLDKNTGAPFYWVKKIKHLPASERSKIRLVEKHRYNFAKPKVWKNVVTARGINAEGGKIDSDYVQRAFFLDIKLILGDAPELSSILDKEPWIEKYRNEELITLIKRIQKKKYQEDFEDYELRKKLGYDSNSPKTPNFTGLLDWGIMMWVHDYKKNALERERVNGEIQRTIDSRESQKKGEKKGYVVWVHWRQNYDGTRTKLKTVMHADANAPADHYTYLQSWHFTDLDGNDHYYADGSPYSEIEENRGHAGDSRIDFLDDQWQYFLALDIVDKEETRAQWAMVKGSLKIIFAVATTIASAGLAAPFWATAGVLTATYSFGTGVNELVAGAKMDQDHLDKLEQIPGSLLGLYGRAIDEMIGTKGQFEFYGDLINTFMMFKSIKWNSSKDIQKAFSKSGYLRIQKIAENGDYIGFVYSLFGITDVVVDKLTDYDKERLEKVANELKTARKYYHKIRNARYSD